MPSELRHILFRPVEVIHAVRDYARKSAAPLPSGTVVKCVISEEDKKLGIHLRLTMVPHANETSLYSQKDKSEELELIIESPALTAALISHCVKSGIPLPATGAKSLQIFGHHLGLVISARAKNDKFDVEGLRI